MVELKDVRNFLKSSGIGENYYIGKLNSKKEKSVGIYQIRRFNDYERAIGTEDADHIKRKYISVLVHWNKNAAETETAANKLYDFIRKTNERGRNTLFGEYPVCFIKMLQNEPLDVSTDEFDIYERVIEFVIYYQEK